MGHVGRTLACAAYPTSTCSQPASPRSLRLAESLKSSISRFSRCARLQGSMSGSRQETRLRPPRSTPDTHPLGRFEKSAGAQSENHAGAGRGSAHNAGVSSERPFCGKKGKFLLANCSASRAPFAEKGEVACSAKKKLCLSALPKTVQTPP